MYKLYFDGGIRKGGSSYGIVLYQQEKIILKTGGLIPNREDSNLAEYCALIIGLSRALSLGVREIDVYGDSQNIILQMQKGKGLKGAEYKICYNIIREMMKQFNVVNFHWVPRVNNIEADRESSI